MPFTLTRNEKAGWLRSLATFLIVFGFLFELRKARTPAEGALLAVTAVVLSLVAFKLIARWKQQPQPATSPN